MRKDVDASQRQRTDLARKFNRAIAECCEAEGMCFISLDEELLGNDELVLHALVNPVLADHPYTKLPYVRLITRHLRAIFAR